MATRMLMHLALTFLIILVGYILSRIIRIRLARRRFKKALNELPILPANWFPNGNSREILFDRYAAMKTESYHRRYGPTFGWMMGTKHAVGTIDLDVLKKIHIDEADLHINRVDVGIPIEEVDKSILFAEDDLWRRLRQAFAPSFTKRKIQDESVQSEMDSVVCNLVEHVENRMSMSDNGSEIVVNIGDVIGRYTMDLVFSTFYKQHNKIDYDKEDGSHVLKEALSKITHPIVELTCMLPILKPIVDWLLMRFHTIGKARQLIVGFNDELVNLNLKAREEFKKAERNDLDQNGMVLSDGTVFKRSLLDSFIDRHLEGKLTKAEFRNSALIIFNGATETSSDALYRLIYHLAINPIIQDKLRKSIQENGMESEYMTWCINEHLRLEPPIPASCSRRLGRDIHIAGGTIPKDTFVCTNAFVIHRMPEYWGKDANQFKPERWAQADKFHPMQYFPFGASLRVCPGKEFALQGIKKVLVALLMRYRLDRCSKTSDSVLFHSPFMLYNVREVPSYIRLSRLQN